MSLQTERAHITVCGRQFKTHKVLEPCASGIRAEITRLALDDHHTPRLPGANPVSIERSHFQTLRDSEYVVCEKTDGVRFIASCLRYQGLKLMVLLDRAMTVYLFPLRKVPRCLFQGTIVDGELAWDRIDETFVFLSFDAVVVSGVSVGHLTLYDRLGATKKAFEMHAPHPDDPAAFRIKSFVPLKLTAMIPQFLDDVSKRFDVDGVILTPAMDEIKYGRHFRLFKLKTGGKHTVDFLVDSHGGLGIYDSKSKKHVVVGQMMFDIPPEGTIVECSHMGGGDPSIKFWKFVGVRADKTTANDMLTYEKTMLNMRENIVLDDILRL